MTTKAISTPSDHVRLARAFAIVPMRLKGSMTASGTLALLGLVSSGVMLIPAAAILVGIAAKAVEDRRIIVKRLREVEAWGFPVEGYRAWLLADEPAFDLELRQAVALDVIEPAAIAVEPTLKVERRSERIVRIVTRRIDLPANHHEPAMMIGDRRLLFDLRDRILAPLHADVGIVAMRMGDRSTMTALVPTRGATASADPHDEVGGAFRDQAMAAPPALQALMRLGTAQLRPASDAHSSSSRLERIMYATGRVPTGVGTVVAIMLGGAASGAQLGGIGALIGMIGGIGIGLYTTVGRNKVHLKAVLGSVAKHGFVVEGYDDWLISGRPIFDIELRAPADRLWLAEKLQITAYSVSSGTHVPWVEGVSWLSETLVRVETRPMLVEPSAKSVPPFYGGSRILFEQLIRDVLVSLHANTGIVAVRMGGYVDRRG